MNITLGDEFEKRIAMKVESGLYTSASEVIRDGLRLLFEKDVMREKQADLLKEEVVKGFKQLDTEQYGNHSVAELFQKAVDRHDDTHQK